MSHEAQNDPLASPDSTGMFPIGSKQHIGPRSINHASEPVLFGLPWLWRQCWVAGLMLVAIWIITAIMDQFNGGTVMCSSWAGSFGLILGMTSQMWIQQRFK